MNKIHRFFLPVSVLVRPLFYCSLTIFIFIGQSHAQTKISSPTWGGAIFGYESTWYQQITYGRTILKAFLANEDFDLIEESIKIDSLRDLSNKAFERYTRNAKGQIIYYDFIPRSLHFLCEDNAGRIYKGSIYLIEQVLNKRPDSHKNFHQERLKRNATEKIYDQPFRENVVILSLSYDVTPEVFEIEVTINDLHLKEISSDETYGLSSAQLLQSLNDIISLNLAPKQHLVKSFLDISDFIYIAALTGGGKKVYPDFQHYRLRALNMKFIEEDTTKTHDAWAYLALGKFPSVQNKPFEINSTLRVIKDILSDKKYSLWLMKDIGIEDARVEISLDD